VAIKSKISALMSERGAGKQKGRSKLTANEIRKIPLTNNETPTEIILREIAAQLAELNFNIRELRNDDQNSFFPS